MAGDTVKGSAPAYAQKLRATVTAAAAALGTVPDGVTAKRPAPGKWSAREVLGHLIDSAANNHRRFVMAESQSDLVFDGYEQDLWVRRQGYAEEPWAELLTLWRAYNLHLARVMEQIPPDVRQREHRRHNLDQRAWRPVPPDQPATLDYFMADYVDHLVHHLAQISALTGVAL